MKLAINYLFKLFLIWATVKTVLQLVSTFQEEFTTFLTLPINKLRFSVRACFGYASVIILFKNNNETFADCVEIFGQQQCEFWRDDQIRSASFYLRGFVPRKFIEFGRRVLAKNKMIIPYDTVRFNLSHYLAQRMFCVLFRKNADFDDYYFKMYINSKIQIRSGAEKMNLRIYINDHGEYPDKNDYIFSTSIERLRHSPAILILLRHELFVQHHLKDLDDFFDRVHTKHHENETLRCCRYRCERRFKLHNPTLLYLDDDVNVTLSDEKLLDESTVNNLTENCILKYCRLSNDINSFYTVAGISRIEEQEMIIGRNISAIHLWFYVGELIFKRSKLCLIDLVINIGFAFSLYFGWNLIGLNPECLTKLRLNKLYDRLLFVVSFFFFVNICSHYYGQINESEVSRYSRFFPEFSNFTFSVCFPVASLIKNKSQTLDQIKLGELDEMTYAFKDVVVGFSLLNMATLKRCKLQHQPVRTFFFRKDKCWSFDVTKNVMFMDQAFFRQDERSREVYFLLFERYFQVYLIFDQIYKIYVTELGKLPYEKTDFTMDPMTFLKIEDRTPSGDDFVAPEMQAKYNCKTNSDCVNKCFLSKTLNGYDDGSPTNAFHLEAVLEPSKLEKSLLDLPFRIINANLSDKLNEDCYHDLKFENGQRFIFSSYISSRALGISELLLLQLSMPSHIYSVIKSNQLFDIVLNLFGCYFLIFGSSFYSLAFLLKTYLKNYIILDSHRSVLNKQLKFVQEPQDKFWKAFFDISFILICLIGLYVLLRCTHDSVKENPIIVSHQGQSIKFGYLIPPSLILCFHVGLIGTNNTELLYNYTHAKNRHHNYTAAQLLHQTKSLADFVKSIKYMNSSFQFSEISNRSEMANPGESQHDNLLLRTFFYSMHKCFSFSVDFQRNYNGNDFFANFEMFYLRNTYLKAEGSNIFKITLSDDLGDDFPPMIVYLEANNLFLMNEPMIMLKNKSISVDYKAFFQLPTSEDFEVCLGKFNNETPSRRLRERVKRTLNTSRYGQLVSPEFPVFQKNWNKTLFSFDESSLDDLKALQMLHEPLLGIDLSNISNQCVLDYITNLREISLSEGDNFIQVRHNAPDFIYSQIFKYSPSEIFLAYGNIVSLWFGISFDSFISISFRLFEDLRKFTRLILFERVARVRANE